MTVQIDLNALSMARLDRVPGAPERAREGRRRSRAQGLHSLPERDEPGLHADRSNRYGRRADACRPDHPYVANAYELVAGSGPAAPGEWHIEHHDLSADFHTAFGRAVDRINAICLMSDGDQTGALLEGWYGDIILQAR